MKISPVSPVLARFDRRWRGLWYVLFVSSLCVGAAGTPSAVAAEKRCTCTFDDPDWTAYGTKAACTVFMHNDNHSCNLAFAGIGADTTLISKVLQLNSSEYNDTAYDISIDYVSRLRKDDVSGLTQPEFLQTAIPIFMRAAFIRGTPDEAAAADLRILNDAIVVFMKQRAEDVGKAFRGEIEGFTDKIEGFTDKDEERSAVFTVGKGTIIVDYRDAKIVTTFLPGD